ncbi:MAG: alpha/beta hydrolase [Alphaproteobacteria bacterium]
MSETDTLAPTPRIIPRPDGATIAYHKIEGSNPGVVFIHGLTSDMTGGKALALEHYCRARGRSFVRFDCFGHGSSSGAFIEGSVGRWVEDTVAVLDELTEGPQVIVGSSMGGWVMLLAALTRPSRVAGLVGIATAADFTEDIIWQALSWEQRDALRAAGWIRVEGKDGETYDISQILIEDGRENLVLRGPIDVRCPVRLIHGLEDPDVPWQTSMLIQERLASTDVEVTLVKGGGHRLSESHDIDRLIRTVDTMMANVQVE